MEENKYMSKVKMNRFTEEDYCMHLIKHKIARKKKSYVSLSVRTAILFEGIIDGGVLRKGYHCEILNGEATGDSHLPFARRGEAPECILYGSQAPPHKN